jgi:hypothetical protein
MDNTLLQKVPLLGSLPPAELADMAASLGEIRYPAGTVLFHEGDYGDRFYILLEGQIAIVKALGSDEKIDDVLISLTTQVQIIHPLPTNPSIFTYLIGDKSKASLAMARYKAAEADLLIQL